MYYVLKTGGSGQGFWSQSCPNALAVTTNLLGFVFNVTPSGENTYEFNARFSQMKTSGRLFHAIQIFYKNNAIWDMHAWKRGESILSV